LSASVRPPAAPRRSSKSSKTAASKPLKEKRQAKKEIARSFGLFPDGNL
jgi:hypothetical protein